MAYIDAQLLFSDAQAITVDAYATNVIDLGIARNLFDGNPLALVLTVDVAADITTGDETYAVQIRTDDNSSMTTPTTVSTTTVTAANLALGKQVVLPIAIGTTLERYVTLYYDVGGTTPTATVTAFLTPLDLVDKRKVYADNSTIS